MFPLNIISVVLLNLNQREGGEAWLRHPPIVKLYSAIVSVSRHGDRF